MEKINIIFYETSRFTNTPVTLLMSSPKKLVGAHLSNPYFN
ncbi:MAG: hypothetical protein JETT_0572 [Candidatus Jettenia ecosi]|uniref:Uncharacterized protein n=1 Tax=Candidatus Jettenia ecosi TaxID=2494326 RepID=A0A533QEE9_9BACT|nr:MAG: hypothetical protein JETT_0572 [Candidatus Jettenia ecosi]